MTLHGVFIGVDRCASPYINELGFAQRDATALHALFTDTFGGKTKLLTDQSATRSAIEQALEELTHCKPDDVVVISFSGHGTRTRHLVVHDTDKQNLDSTAISLSMLRDYFARIPAQRLFCFLDCCFSGGIGAKVLEVEAIPRDLTYSDELLDQMSGKGRIILAASLASEPAWEYTKLRHGLLTYYLIQGLLGAEEVRKAGKISVYRLIELVSQSVADYSQQKGRPQHATLHGEIESNLTWPIFKRGKLYAAGFPEQLRPTVKADIQSLGEYGFPQPLIDAWAGTIPTLNQLQLAAINEFGLLEGCSLIVSAPTSSGKTMIGELAALKGALTRQRAIFLLPLKALANDKHRYFSQVYGSFGIRTIRVTGDTTVDDNQPLLRGQYDICLMTYEKFTAMVLGMPHILEQVGTVVVDEVQVIADEARGVNLEFILTLLRLRRRQGIEPQLIALSAVIGDTHGLERWLDAKLLRRTERPVPLDEGVIRADGSFRYIASDTGEEKVVRPFITRVVRKGSSQDWIIPLVGKLVAEGKKAIVFREIKAKARSCANYLAESLGLAPAQDTIDQLPTGDPSLSSARLHETLRGGVGFHTADLDAEERQLIEEHFRDKTSSLKILAATTTLAMGVNTPAEAVVIAGLEHPGNKPYSIAEYKNIAGRAGRLGQASRGASYLIATNSRDEDYYWSRYIKGQPEDITSRFLASGTDIRSLMIRILTTAPKGMTAAEIISFLEESFGAFQQRQQTEGWKWNQHQLMEAVHSLHQHQLIKAGENQVYRLTELGRLAGEAGVEVESIIRLVHALRHAEASAINDPALIAVTQLTVELDRELFPINHKSTQKEPQTWFAELQRQRVPTAILQALRSFVTQDIKQTTLRAKKTVGCLLWITDRTLTEIEKVLTQFGGAFDAAGPLRNVKSRTCDFLPIVARVAEILHPELDLGERVSRLLTRLEVGVPPAAYELAKQAGLRLSRGDYQQLLRADRCSIAVIEQCADEDLLACLGNDTKKLAILRKAIQTYHQQQREQAIAPPILPPYEA